MTEIEEGLLIAAKVLKDYQSLGPKRQSGATDVETLWRRVRDWEACYAQLFNFLNKMGGLLKERTDELNQLKLTSGWQNIETVPKDGSHLWLLSSDGINIGWYSHDTLYWHRTYEGNPKNSPTHWKHKELI